MILKGSGRSRSSWKFPWEQGLFPQCSQIWLFVPMDILLRILNLRYPRIDPVIGSSLWSESDDRVSRSHCTSEMALIALYVKPRTYSTAGHGIAAFAAFAFSLQPIAWRRNQNWLTLSLPPELVRPANELVGTKLLRTALRTSDGVAFG